MDNSNGPLISVVVTAHNMEGCLGECLESIAGQTFGEFECLVVNDGSTDGTGAVARAFAANDSRFSVVDTPGLGAGGARNHGLNWVNAPFFMLLDGDDVFHPTMFEKLYRAAEASQADVAICNMQEMDDATGEFTPVAWALKRSQLPSGAGGHAAGGRGAAGSAVAGAAANTGCVAGGTAGTSGGAASSASATGDEANGHAADGAPADVGGTAGGYIAFGGWCEMPGNLFAAFMGWPWDKLYRTEFIQHEGLRFPEDLSNSEDGVFVFPALVCAERIAVVDEVLVDHRMQRGNTVSSSRVREPYAFYEAICRVKAFLVERGVWEALGQDFLAWAFDWTLWNIETIGDAGVARKMAQHLHDGGFPELELGQHAPSYFTGYPNSMARYTDLMHTLGEGQQDSGPLGACRKLPFGKYKPWCFKSYLGRVLAARKLKNAPPSEW